MSAGFRGLEIGAGGVANSGCMPDMARRRTEETFPLVIQANALKHPDRTALVHGERTLTFAEFHKASVDAARAMIVLGVDPGDRVVIWAPNSVDWLVAAMGVLAAGGVLVPVNNRLRGAEVADIVGRSGASAVITVDRFLNDRPAAMLRDAAPDLHIAVVDLMDAGAVGTVSWQGLLARGAAEVTLETATARTQAIPADAACDILFTSGTTGVPKGVVSTHAKNMMAWAGAYLTLPQLGPEDALLLIPPLGLLYGFKAIFMLGSLAGATIVMQTVFTAESTMEAIQSHGITYLAGPPTLFQDVLDCPERDRYDLGSLRHAHVAGTSIPPALIARIRDEGVAGRVTVGYGMSECGPVTLTGLDDDAETIASTVGRPVTGMSLKLVDDEGVQVGLDTPGEILVKGPWVVDGYFQDPEQTAQAFTADGWLRTGDVGTVDERGYLRIIGRKKEMFIVGGFNVYPVEVERCMAAHAALSDVAVVPMPDARLGEVGVAFVVLADGASVDPDELIAWTRRRVAGYKAPREIYVVDELPRNASSKLLRDELRDRVAEMVSTRNGPSPTGGFA